LDWTYSALLMLEAMKEYVSVRMTELAGVGGHPSHHDEQGH
jgi:hypothetical protein